MVSPEHYGMHAHFADAGSIVLFGGGSGRFRLRSDGGRTPCPNRKPDHRGCARRSPGPGIPPTLACEIERRPFYVTKDGKEKHPNCSPDAVATFRHALSIPPHP